MLLVKKAGYLKKNTVSVSENVEPWPLVQNVISLNPNSDFSTHEFDLISVIKVNNNEYMDITYIT